MIVRPIEPRDVEEVTALAEEQFGDRAAALHHTNTVFVAESARGDILGFVAFRYTHTTISGGLEYRITWMAAKHEGRGVGTALMRQVFRLMKALGVEHLTGLTTTPKYFHRLGFDTIRTFDGGWHFMLNSTMTRRPL
jgi:predicted N-acetyltransferase YhbS